MPIEFIFLDYLQKLRTPLLDQLMLFVTALAGDGEIVLGFGVVLLCFKRTRKAGLTLLIAMLIFACSASCTCVRFTCFL